MVAHNTPIYASMWITFGIPLKPSLTYTHRALPSYLLPASKQKSL